MLKNVFKDLSPPDLNEIPSAIKNEIVKEIKVSQRKRIL